MKTKLSVSLQLAGFVTSAASVCVFSPGLPGHARPHQAPPSPLGEEALHAHFLGGGPEAQGAAGAPCVLTGSWNWDHERLVHFPRRVCVASGL